MSRLDGFTKARLIKFIKDFRDKNGQLPTLNDLEENHFEKETVQTAIKEEVIEKFYVTLTNGTIVKGYKLKA